jgi:hypothetical protein
MKTLAGHGSIILTLMFVTLLIVDRYNPTMDFINNNVTKALILLLCLFSVYDAVLVLSGARARVRRREEKRREALRAKRIDTKNRPQA